MKGQKGLTRREMLKLSGTVAAGSLLVACAPTVTSTVASTLVPPTVAATASVPPTVAPTAVPPTSVPAAAGPVTLEVLDPSGAYEVTQVFAPRLSTLEGKTICFLSDEHWEADRTLPLIQDLLQKQFPTVKFVSRTEFPMGTTGIDVAGIGNMVKAKGCDAVILGNAG